MPILTIRLSEEELVATEQAARRQQLNKSEFARRAITAAAAKPVPRAASMRGAWKGRTTYKEAMNLLRG